MGVLQKLFGSVKEKNWRRLADEVGGEFVPGGFLKDSKVRLRYRQWTFTLDLQTESSGENSVIYTRLRAPYMNRGGFRFTIYRKGFFSNLGKLLGMQDIEIGEAAFDEAFIIKGTDENPLRSLLADRRIRQLIERQPTIHLTVRDNEGWFKRKFPEDVDELCFQVPGILTDLDQLKSLFDLFAAILDRLCESGSAYQDNPGVEL